MNTEFTVEMVGAIFALWIIYLIATRKERKAKKEKKVAAQRNRLAEKLTKSDMVIKAKHVTGLPIAEGTQCTVSYLSDKIEIKQGANTFALDLSKVTDITTTTDTEIQKNYVSSAGGAVGGALLFGPLGAIVGGRTKEKKTTTVTHYLIITYNTDNEVKYISFECDKLSRYYEFKIRFSLTNNNKENNTITL